MKHTLLLACVAFGGIACAATATAFAQTPVPVQLAQAVASPTPGPAVTIPPALPPIVKYAHYVEAGYIAPALICNEFSPCSPGRRYKSTAVRAALEFPLIKQDLTGMVKVDYRRYGYTHQGGLVTNVGGAGLTFVPAFDATEYELDLRGGVQVTGPRVYAGVSYLRRGNNYGYPTLRGVGAGIEKLPDVDQILSLYGSFYYYPDVKRDYYLPGAPGTTYTLGYHELRYDFGATLKPSANSPVFVDIGYLGDKSRNAGNAPINETRNGPFLGIGVNF